MATLTDQVAIITGGSKGIGKATALRLARDGAKVVIQYYSDDQGAQEVVDAIGDQNALAVKGMTVNVADTEDLIYHMLYKFGQIDILIANAGKAVPYLRPGCRIILVSTTLCHASTINPRYLLYLTTKGAVEQMVRVLAKELGPKEITVNAASPGPTDTALFNNGMSAPVLAAVKNLIPRGRLGTPDEIAEVMAFFSSPASGWVSGQILRVNGGMA